MSQKVAVFIGRFSPFHNGHLQVVKKALEKADRLIILIGSSHRARSLRTPFTFEERRDMIDESIMAEDLPAGCVTYAALEDHPKDEVWEANVRHLVSERTDPDDEIFLVGFAKDHSSYYLKKFPEWGSIAIESAFYNLSSTHVRDIYFSGRTFYYSELRVPAAVEDFLRKFETTVECDDLEEESHYIANYKASWKDAPFSPVFVTVDAVVVQSGHILLVTRGGFPGKGLLALPGGFLNPDEYIRDAAVRELREETLIEDHLGRIPAAKLESFIEEVRVYDDPNRSGRGRTITHAHLFKLPEARRLYPVKGDDDATHAAWYRIADLDPSLFFEDHYEIIQDFLGL